MRIGTPNGAEFRIIFSKKFKKPSKSISPELNRCVIFNTTSSSYHGHPEPISCPENISRRSIATYYFSVGRPTEELNEKHKTLFKEVKGEKFNKASFSFRESFKLFIPPILLLLKKFITKK